ncbi:3'-5' exoribonuclease YhaM family protein [Pilibacter termitis]|nr:HD domain-containing protein [Pilibacter termitis]
MNVRTSKAGKRYQQFKFRDKTGEINGFLWDTNEYTVKTFVANTVVHFTGRKELYQGIPQVNQIKLRTLSDSEPSDPQLYEKQGVIKREVLEEGISEFLFLIKQGHYARIARNLLEKYREEFFTYPAAKSLHHDFAGGLAYHTLTMLKVAKGLLEVYPQMNASLLYTGILLHDLGKVLELSGNGNTQYTLRGQLLGHIVLIDEEIIKATQELKIDDADEDVVVLRHLILSHHGQLEFGSPVRPKVLEAEVIHFIDNLDAKVTMITSAIDTLNNGEQTPRVLGLDNRNFYKPLI